MKTNVTVEKLKVVKPEIQAEAPEQKDGIVEKIEKVINAAFSKFSGKYDGQYQESPEEPEVKKDEESVPGVPGTEKKAGEYDGKYQEEKKAEEAEDEGEEMEECVCEKCGSTYKKAKKSAEEGDVHIDVDSHKDNEGEEGEEEEKKAEEEVLPKKAEASAEVPMDLSSDAWRKLMIGAEPIKESKQVTDWKSACSTTFNGSAFDK